MAGAVQGLCREASACIDDGCPVLTLSDRRVGPARAAIPSLLAVAAVHHPLVREGTRLRAGLVIESGEPREVHHMCCLIRYRAAAIKPYLMLEALDELAERGGLPAAVGRHEARVRG